MSFEDLSNNDDFADVTLAYEDGQQGEAHKVMLSYHIFHLWSCKAQQEGAEQRETECGRLREGRLQLPPQLSSLPSALLWLLRGALFDPRRNIQGRGDGH